MTRKPKVNREDFPLVYVGPSTRYGPKNGTPARKVGKGRSGMIGFTAPDGQAWQVPPSQLVRYEPPRRAPRLERVREMFQR